MQPPVGYNKQRAAALMEKHNLDFMFVSSPLNVWYTTGLPMLHSAPNPILEALSNKFPNFSIIRRDGSVTAISAVSPPGGDISEPVTQNTLRVVRVFWGLDSELARQRHFPSINWMNSYSLYADMANSYYNQFVDEDASKVIGKAAALLQEENHLLEIVKLVGFDSISDVDKLKLEISKSIREDYLQQNAFDTVDSHSSLKKQIKIIKLIIDFYETSMKLIEKETVSFADYYEQTKSLRERIARVKFISEGNMDAIDAVARDVSKYMEAMSVYVAEALGQ